MTNLFSVVSIGTIWQVQCLSKTAAIEHSAPGVKIQLMIGDAGDFFLKKNLIGLQI